LTLSDFCRKDRGLNQDFHIGATCAPGRSYKKKFAGVIGLLKKLSGYGYELSKKSLPALPDFPEKVG
jgi:hypothetical protein